MPRHTVRARVSAPPPTATNGSRRRPYPHRRQRIFDLLIVTPALVVAAPLIAAVAVAVRVALGKPVLFRQVRPGWHGQPFTLVKFRTMTDERDADGNLLPDSERITPFGRFLRHSSLDELPELWNIFKGDMSLVGPRPLLMRYLDRYSPEQMRRHDVRPGLTGWCQVNGRNALGWDDKFALDLWYVDNRSLYLDIKIIMVTVWKILKREGICHPGSATTLEFLGAPRPFEPLLCDNGDAAERHMQG